MPHIVCVITPAIEAKLADALALLDDILSDDKLCGERSDPRVVEACEILKALPCFAKD